MAIMTNGDNGDEVTMEILRTVAKEYNWRDFQPEEHTISKIDSKLLDACPGSYESLFGTLLVTRKGDELYVAPAGQAPLQMYYDEKGDFFVREFGVSFSCEIETDGKASRLVLHQPGQDVPAKRK